MKTQSPKTRTVATIGWLIAVLVLATLPAFAQPYCGDDYQDIQMDTPEWFYVLGNDSSGEHPFDTFSLAIETQAMYGVADTEPFGGMCKYTPFPGFIGWDTFTYTIKDTAGQISNAAIVHINVVSPQGPTAYDDFAYFEYDETAIIDVLGNDMVGDASLDPSTLVIISGPQNGTANINSYDSTITYTPNSGFAGGSDSFQYVVQDQNGVESNTATVNIYIDPNDPPEIYFFDCWEGSGNVWHFVGNVTDEHPEGLIITFSGRIIGGETCVVGPDGSFEHTKILEENVVVGAQTTDDGGNVSNMPLVDCQAGLQ